MAEKLLVRSIASGPVAAGQHVAATTEEGEAVSGTALTAAELAGQKVILLVEEAAFPSSMRRMAEIVDEVRAREESDG